MDKGEIAAKAKELKAILTQYKADLGLLERELLAAIEDYQAALKKGKLEAMWKDIAQTT